MAGRVVRERDHADGPMDERFWWLDGEDDGGDDADCVGDDDCGGDDGGCWLDDGWNGHPVYCRGDGGLQVRQKFEHDPEYQQSRMI